MCSCVTKHEGIKCTEVGCTCHEDSPTIWCAGAESRLQGFFLINNTMEEQAQSLAESRRDLFYFFATLTV